MTHDSLSPLTGGISAPSSPRGQAPTGASPTNETDFATIWQNALQPEETAAEVPDAPAPTDGQEETLQADTENESDLSEIDIEAEPEGFPKEEKAAPPAAPIQRAPAHAQPLSPQGVSEATGKDIPPPDPEKIAPVETGKSIAAPLPSAPAGLHQDMSRIAASQGSVKGKMVVEDLPVHAAPVDSPQRSTPFPNLSAHQAVVHQIQRAQSSQQPDNQQALTHPTLSPEDEGQPGTLKIATDDIQQTRLAQPEAPRLAASATTLPVSTINPTIVAAPSQQASLDQPELLDATIDASTASHDLHHDSQLTHAKRSNALASLTPSRVDQHVASQVTAAIRPLSPGTTEIALSPPELGKVKITVSAQEQGMLVAVTAERQDTFELLRRNIDTLSQDLRTSGEENISFSFSRSDTDTESEGQSRQETAGNNTSQHLDGISHVTVGPGRHILSANLDMRI